MTIFGEVAKSEVNELDDGASEKDIVEFEVPVYNVCSVDVSDG